MEDFYKILGVNKSASEDDIKRAYRKLAHEHHPDKSSGNEKKFKEVNEAYQVLGSKEKRAQYDRFGTAGVGGQAGYGHQHAGGGFGGFSGFEGNFDPEKISKVAGKISFKSPSNYIGPVTTAMAAVNVLYLLMHQIYRENTKS